LRATSRIITESLASASPWNAGRTILRRTMCSGSSVSITERRPSTGGSSGLATAKPTLSPAVKIVLMSAMSASTTQSPQ
jgi:hypothetical protein